ncbi:hypothetical protein SAMN05421736_11481 [Evansella caseinilytica]|uniref:DUF4878 domain-containing protein n=1 Tax=Evansella caseinilytica TaxID=1503961 RepID=A0A1H3TG59_9BACI|nr:hypothetical protein [Evansella caseinilytica]SDZ48831.1 hypothetical protein SAMN05421736_11481 [Evansella caseinilytica]
MKKAVIPVLFIILTLIISACSGEKAKQSSPEAAIKSLYTAALNNDLDTFTKIISNHEDFDSYYVQDALDAVKAHIVEYGGVSNLKITEIKRKDLLDEAAEDLDYWFGEDWSMVMEDYQDEDDLVHLWLLKKVDGLYYVIASEEFYKEEFLKKY